MHRQVNQFLFVQLTFLKILNKNWETYAVKIWNENDNTPAFT